MGLVKSKLYWDAANFATSCAIPVLVLSVFIDDKTLSAMFIGMSLGYSGCGMLLYFKSYLETHK